MKSDLLTPLWSRLQSAPAPTYTVREWETLLGQARQSRLMGRLATYFVDHGGIDAVPLGPRRHLLAALRWVDRQHHAVRWEVDCIGKALAGQQGPVLLLKGAAYLAAGLPPSRARLFADIDLMVERDRITEVEGALLAAGWISTDRDVYTQRYYREWMHEIPPIEHVHRHSVIDLHHTITPPTSRFNVDGSRLLAQRVAVVDGGRFCVLSPVDMVLHSAVHLFQEGEFDHGLRDLLDMNDLLLHFGQRQDFWDELLARAQDLKLKIPLFHALFHVRRLFGTVAPEALQPAVAALQPHWLPRVVMSALLSRALYPHHPSCDPPGGGLARWLLYVRSHYIRMPLRLVIPHLIRKAWMRNFAKTEGSNADPKP